MVKAIRSVTAASAEDLTKVAHAENRATTPSA